MSWIRSHWKPLALIAALLMAAAWNILLQLIPERTITGRVTHDGDLHILFSLYKPGEGHVQVQFFIDEWMYHSPYSSRNLTLWAADSRETGEALAEVFQPLLASG